MKIRNFPALLLAILCVPRLSAQTGEMPAPREYSLDALPTLNSLGANASSPSPSLEASPAPTATPAPTPLPDGSQPATLPAMPPPALEDAATLSGQLSTNIPTPAQSPEPLRPPAKADQLQESERLAMEQKMVMADFEKSLARLIAKQRNPEVPDLTIDGAVQTALKLNPDILNAIQQIRLTRGQLIQVAAQAIPQISISSGYQQKDSSLNPNTRRAGPAVLTIPNPSGGPPTVLELASAQPEEQNQTWNIQFQGSQLIYDGGATISGIRAGQAAYDSAFFSLRATIDAVVARVITQFYQVVLNRALIVAQQQNVALLEQQVKDQQNRFEAGTVPRFNVLQAEVALANAKPPLIQAENAYRISLYQLVKLLGMDAPRGRPEEVPFNVVGTLGYNPREVDTATSIRVAIARNPSLKAQRQAILAQAANVNAQIGGFFPRINATAGWQFQNDTTSSDLSKNLSGWFFGATGTWNFWDGGQTYGQVAQAKAQLMQAKNTYEDGVRGVVLQVQEAISNLRQARETIDSQTASVVQATEALRLARERLDAGAGTQLDVLNAQVQLLQAQTNVLQARYDYLAAMAAYDQALSLDTQYVEIFDDPLVRPLNPQALSAAETRRFNRVTSPDRPQAPLPKKFRKDDPAAPYVEPTPKPARAKIKR